uniref:LIM zinc-binding domain-containing protein n=1 Tax=Monopterus albus TaxID=43700 RepID=A0A3Q3J0B6_MONAL
MASPVADIGQSHQHQPVTGSAADSAFQEAQKWIEAVTGRCFGDKDFRGGLENGILLCELLSSIKPGLVKKINRLPTPIAGLVLVTIYWLGRAANGCTSYNGPTLDLKEFEGLLSQMRKETEDAESPKRGIRDSGYIDCWDSERSDSLSPPHHGREDSFDSLDSLGSRSQQTPSPDVLVARGSSDGRGSDSESDGTPHRKMPDVRKDDMSARRTSLSEPRISVPFNQYLPNKSNQSGYLPLPLRKKGNNKEEGGCKSWSTATSPVGGDRPFSTPARSCSEELFHHSTTLAANATAGGSVAATNPVEPTGKHPPVTDPEEAGVKKAVTGNLSVTGAAHEKKQACHTVTSTKHITTSSPSDFLPVPAAMATTSREMHYSGRLKARAPSESDDTQRGTSWLDSGLPATSMSMSDMRGEEETILQPHSQVRHELMHNQYYRMKEDDDHWQDDLARWKSRRRSISQDLIKKEEERKMMEQLMSGTSMSQRRRSVKTYREIVEDKELREEELRQAYRKARTPEEAAAILQRYAQRFSISEAILERLQLPKLLDRSISADPSFPLSLSSSPTTPDPFDMDPNGPMKYLRQMSAPAPKFTSTLEAQIEEFPKDSSSHQRPQIRSCSSDPPSTRALSPKPVPLLTPKPYWPSKADGLLRVNGDIGGNDVPTTPESQGIESPPYFQASPSKTNSTVDAPSPANSPTHSPHTSTGGVSPESTKAKEVPGGRQTASNTFQEEKVPEHSTPPSRPTSLPTKLQKPEENFGKMGGQKATAPEEVKSNGANQPAPSTEAKQERERTEPSTRNVSILVQPGVSTQLCQPVTLQPSVPSSQELSHRRDNVPSSAATGSFEYHPPREMAAEFANSVRSALATSNPKLRWEFFTPPEEAETDHRGNEKYRREQEKLKEEWEKAQREVAEEERKYHEEERRILEETVTPLTPHSPALSSPSRGELSSTSEPQGTIVRSLADWERKQELLERQLRESTESLEWRRKENDRTSDISTADDSMKTARSSVSQSSSQAQRLSHSLQNGQKPAPMQISTPQKKQELAAVSNKPGRPTGDRRSGPIDNNMSHSPSKPPTACPPPPDTLPPAPNRSVSGKKLCSSCGQPLGKGAAMIIETLSLYFHIHCFKCGVCKGQLGDTTTGTDVRIRNGLLNCHQCYIRSRSAGQPTTL